MQQQAHIDREKASHILGVHHTTVWRWVKSGKLPRANRRGAIRIRLADVAALKAQQIKAVMGEN